MLGILAALSTCLHPDLPRPGWTLAHRWMIGPDLSAQGSHLQGRMMMGEAAHTQQENRFNKHLLSPCCVPAVCLLCDPHRGNHCLSFNKPCSLSPQGPAPLCTFLALCLTVGVRHSMVNALVLPGFPAGWGSKCGGGCCLQVSVQPGQSLRPA